MNASGPPHYSMCPCTHPQASSRDLYLPPLYPEALPCHSALLGQQLVPTQHTMCMYILVFSALWARGVIVNPTVDDTFIPSAAGGVNLWLYLQAVLLGFLGCF